MWRLPFNTPASTSTSNSNNDSISSPSGQPQERRTTSSSSSSSLTRQRQQSVAVSSTEVQHLMSVVAAPIEDATQAFSPTVALINAGAMYMEQGDYVSSIKALTSSFLSFQKTYNREKSHLVSLRTLIQESERHGYRTTKTNHDSSSASSPSAASSSTTLESMIFNVDELFSWRRRRGIGRGKGVCKVAPNVAGSSLETVSARTRSKLSNKKNHNNDRSGVDCEDCHSRSHPSAAIANRNPDHVDDCIVDDSVSVDEKPAVGSAAAATTTFDVVMEEDDEEEDDDSCIVQDVPSVYSNPIRLPPDFPITQESCGFLTTTISLNLALANHLYALELLERQQQQHNTHPPVLTKMIHQHLTSAIRYYEYTVRLKRARQQEEQRRMATAAATLSQSPHLASSSSSSLLSPLFVSPFALLVVFNNLGQLHLILNDKDQSQRCYRQLQSTLMFLLLHSPKTFHDNSKNLAVFMENATLGLQKHSSSRSMAAAA